MDTQEKKNDDKKLIGVWDGCALARMQPVYDRSHVRAIGPHFLVDKYEDYRGKNVQSVYCGNVSHENSEK